MDGSGFWKSAYYQRYIQNIQNINKVSDICENTAKKITKNNHCLEENESSFTLGRKVVWISVNEKQYGDIKVRIKILYDLEIYFLASKPGIEKINLKTNKYTSAIFNSTIISH